MDEYKDFMKKFENEAKKYQCEGCGVKIQWFDEKKGGYVNKEKLL